MNTGSNIQHFGGLLDQRFKQQMKVQTRWVNCSEVDWNEKTMTAIGLSDGLPFYDVQLGLGSYYRKPLLYTKCLIGLIENKDAASFLIDCEQFEEAIFHAGNDTEMVLNDKGFIVKSAGESLKEVLNEWQGQFGNLCDEINKIVVSIGTSPNVPAVTQIKQAVLNDLQQRLNKILTA